MRQILDVSGQIIDPKLEPKISDKELRKMYEIMSLVRLLDDKGIKLQRQGRIGFYVPSTGQEATQIGLVAALKPNDWVFPSYREIGVAFYRQLELQTLINQWFGNKDDLSKGRRLSCLFGHRESNFVDPSAPISTQVIQAAGAGYAAKYKKDGNVVAVFFGDGGTSANDFHSGMNFACVFKSRVIFFCQNNQWAISVPLSRQTAAESIAAKAVAYGMPGEQIDGNDILAVYAAVSDAAKRARKGEGPSLIEAITYRLGPHTTSDDPTRYRTDEEVEKWRKTEPLKRFKLYLQKKGIWSDDDDQKLLTKFEKDLDIAVDNAAAAGPPDIEDIFTDVFIEMPWHLKEQYEQLKEFKSIYKED